MDVNIGVECELKCLRDTRHPDAIGIDTRYASVVFIFRRSGTSEGVKAGVWWWEEIGIWFSCGNQRECYLRSGGSGGAVSGLEGEISISRSADEVGVEAGFL